MQDAEVQKFCAIGFFVLFDGFCRCMCAQWLLPNPNPLHLWLIHIYVTRIVYVAVLFILLDIEFPPAASIIAQELLLVAGAGSSILLFLKNSQEAPGYSTYARSRSRSSLLRRRHGVHCEHGARGEQ